MTASEARLVGELRRRRDRLAELADGSAEDRLVELLRRVDRVLGDAEQGHWGLCSRCHEGIDPARLAADPFASVCLECLSPEERRALELDLQKAAAVQRQLLPPREQTHCGWQIAWLWEPHGAVSGDHLDVLPPSCEGAPAFALLGDVAGKGVAASFLQAHLHALFRALAAPGSSLIELLARANRLFFASTSAASYATLIALRLVADGTAEIANAGHPRPLLADRRGVRPIEGSGLPLGLFEDASYATRTITLAPGDTLLLYSDGLSEAATAREEYGIGRAAAALRRTYQLPLPELLAACRDDVAAFLAGEPRSDDLSLLAVRRLDG